MCFLLYRLNSSEGWLADAVGNYTVDSKCTWLIEAPSADSNIRLHLKEFATECGWDHLYIFDGDSVFSDVVGVLSGTLIFLIFGLTNIQTDTNSECHIFEMTNSPLSFSVIYFLLQDVQLYSAVYYNNQNEN